MEQNGKEGQAPEPMFFQADALIEEGKVEDAYTLLCEIIRMHPDYGRAYNHLGFLYETKFRDLPKAEEMYQRCLALAPEYPAAYLNYSVLLSQSERWDELASLLLRAEAVPGMNKSKVYNEYGIMHELKGEYAKAIEYYRKAIRGTFIDEDMQRYLRSMERCTRKLDLLNS